MRILYLVLCMYVSKYHWNEKYSKSTPRGHTISFAIILSLKLEKYFPVRG